MVGRDQLVRNLSGPVTGGAHGYNHLQGAGTLLSQRGAHSCRERPGRVLSRDDDRDRRLRRLIRQRENTRMWRFAIGEGASRTEAKPPTASIINAFTASGAKT